MTIKRYLDAKDVAVGNTTEYEKKALDLAKKYSFVTPVTSLVVVKPNATSKPVETEAADQANFPVSQYALQSFPAVGRKYPNYTFYNIFNVFSFNTCFWLMLILLPWCTLIDVTQFFIYRS